MQEVELLCPVEVASCLLDRGGVAVRAVSTAQKSGDLLIVDAHQRVGRLQHRIREVLLFGAYRRFRADS